MINKKKLLKITDPKELEETFLKEMKTIIETPHLKKFFIENINWKSKTETMKEILYQIYYDFNNHFSDFSKVLDWEFLLKRVITTPLEEDFIEKYKGTILKYFSPEDILLYNKPNQDFIVDAFLGHLPYQDSPIGLKIFGLNESDPGYRLIDIIVTDFLHYWLD